MTDDVEALRSRVAELEARNRALQQETDGPDAAPGRSRATAVLRSVVATLLITLSVILAPIAAVGTWAHGQLVDPTASSRPSRRSPTNPRCRPSSAAR